MEPTEVATDPFSEFGGKPVTDNSDPFAEFGGRAIPEAAYEAPQYANGLSPENAMLGESAVDVADRFKLAFGNKEGNVDFLKKKFGDANVVDRGDGELVVKGKDNLWRAVDANTGDSPDPWNVTNRLKEAASEVAEAIPTAARIASGFAKIGGTAAAPATLGTSAVAAAAGLATDAALTSFGRAMGTYKGDWQDQLKDATFEGALNAAGVLFDAGVKPTLGYLGKTKMFTKLKDALTSDDAGTLGEVIKWANGRVSQSSIEQVAKNGDRLDEMIRMKKNLDHTAFQDVLKKESADIATEAAQVLTKRMQAVNSKIYGDVASEVVEGSLKLSNKDLIDPVFTNYANQGLLKIAGKTPKETADLLASQGGKLLDDQAWEIVSLKDLKSLANINPEMDEVLKRAAASPDVYKEIRKPLQEMLSYRTQASPTSSRAQVEQIIKLRQSIKGMTYDAKSSATSGAVQQFFSAAHKNFDSTLKAIVPEGVANKLAAADEKYKSYSNALDMLKKLADTKGTGEVDTYINGIFSKGGGGVRRRSVMDDAIAILHENKDIGAGALEKFKDDIMLRKAAADFTAPMARILSPGAVMSMSAGGIGAAAGTVAGGAEAGAGLGLGATAIGMGLSSPRFGYELLRTQLKANRMISLGASQLATKAEKAAFLKDNFGKLATAGVRMAADREATKEELLSGPK